MWPLLLSLDSLNHHQQLSGNGSCKLPIKCINKEKVFNKMLSIERVRNYGIIQTWNIYFIYMNTGIIWSIPYFYTQCSLICIWTQQVVAKLQKQISLPQNLKLLLLAQNHKEVCSWPHFIQLTFAVHASHSCANMCRFSWLQMCAVPLFTVKILLPPGLNSTTSTVVVWDLNLADEG